MRITRYLFLATVFCVTFEKVHWNVAGTVSLADILAVGFLVAWAVERLGTHDWRLPPTSAIVACFGLAFLLSYLIGYYSIDTADASGQFGKGMLKWAIHILFLVAAIAYLSRRSERFYWQTIGWFAAGFAANAAYGEQERAGGQCSKLGSVWLDGVGHECATSAVECGRSAGGGAASVAN